MGYAKRKKYKYAQFHENEVCFTLDDFVLATELPLVLELGAGHAEFALEYARRHPNRYIVAVDLKRDRLWQGARQAVAEGLKNIQFLNADILKIGAVIPENRVTDIWLTFPDPFFKNRQAKHRMTNPNFLEIYAKLLQKDGSVHLKTDNQMLLASAIESAQVSKKCIVDELILELETEGEGDRYIQTRYEELWREEGQAINYIKFVAK